MALFGKAHLSAKPKGQRVHRYSYTQINMYQRCARQYWYRYIEKMVIPPALPLVEGGSHHQALAHNNKHKIKTGNDLKPKQHFEVFVDAFEKQQPNVSDWQSDSPDSVIKRGKLLTFIYHETYASSIVPLEAERRYNFDLAGHPFVGIIDVELEDSVLDYKVVGRKADRATVQRGLQLTIYAITKDVRNVGLVQLVKTKKPYVHEALSHRTKQEKKHAERIVQGVVESIRKGSFPPCDPTSWWCCPRFCGYFHKCTGFGPRSKVAMSRPHVDVPAAGDKPPLGTANLMKGNKPTKIGGKGCKPSQGSPKKCSVPHSKSTTPIIKTPVPKEPVSS